jgi:hypothetical protein
VRLQGGRGPEGSAGRTGGRQLAGEERSAAREGVPRESRENGTPSREGVPRAERRCGRRRAPGPAPTGLGRESPDAEGPRGRRR